MKSINNIKRVVLVGVFVLSLGGCQDDFESPAGLTGKSIATVMEASPDFNIWTAVIKKVGIYASLNNNNAGSVTIFGPSDPAMTTYLATVYSVQLASLQPVTESTLIAFIDGLSATSNPTLTSFFSTVVPVVNYHIVSSKMTSSQLTGNQTFATYNGARLSVSVMNSVIILNGNSAANGATVTTVDLLGSNGVAHTIDRVMGVPGVVNVLFPLGLSISYTTNPPTITGGQAPDVTGTDFDLLAALIRYTGQVPTILPSSTPLPEFTIFQTNDNNIIAYLTTIDPTLNTEAACYTYISTVTTSSVTLPTLADLTALVQYHIVPGRYLVQDFTNDMVLTTLLTGKDLTAGVVTGPPAIYTIKDLNAATDPTVTASNTLTNSGVLHTINGVLRSN